MVIKDSIRGQISDNQGQCQSKRTKDERTDGASEYQAYVSQRTEHERIGRVNGNQGQYEPRRTENEIIEQKTRKPIEKVIIKGFLNQEQWMKGQIRKMTMKGSMVEDSG